MTLNIEAGSLSNETVLPGWWVIESQKYGIRATKETFVWLASPIWNFIGWSTENLSIHSKRGKTTASFVSNRWLFFLFQVSCLSMRSWHDLNENCWFCEYFGYYLFFMEESFSTESKSGVVIDNVQNLVSKKTTVLSATKRGRRTTKCPSWHCLHYKQRFQHRIELFFNKVSRVFIKMCLFSH